MSDTQNEADADFPQEDVVLIEHDDKPAKRGNGVAWLAVLLSAAALSAVGWTIYEDWRTPADTGDQETLASVDALENSVQSTREALAALENRVSSTPQKDFAADIEAVSESVDEQLRLLNSLPTRMSTLESSVASLAGISEGARQTFLLAEAEYYMQIGNAQLQLANNPLLASLALRMADERVAQLANPALTDVRRVLSDELAALDVMEKPDLEGASLTLSALAGVVDSLPLASAAASEAAAESADDEDQGNVAKAWGSVKGAFSGLVKVTPPEQAKLARLSPDGEQFLRNNIALQLQSARLALLRGEQSIFVQSLDDTSTMITSYFDTTSEPVASALQTIDEIRQGIFATTAPDISNSLRLLRQFRTLRETSE